MVSAGKATATLLRQGPGVGLATSISQVTGRKTNQPHSYGYSNTVGPERHTRDFYKSQDILYSVGGHRERIPEFTATTPYWAYMMDIGLQGDTFELNVTLTIRFLWYGEVGLWVS